jgi:hypothetical protein
MHLPQNRDGKEVALQEKAAPVSQSTSAATAQSASPREAISLRDVEMIRANHQKPSRLIKSGESFNVRLAYAMNEQMRSNGAFEYTALITAIKYGATSRQLLRRLQGVVNAGDEAIMVEVSRPDLPPGLYKIEAALEISPASTKSAVKHSVITQTAMQVY